MSSAGVGPLCFLKSTVNAAIYQEILEHFMLPSADKLYGDADFIFQQDLAPAHTAKGTKSWFNDHGVTVLDWPANSSDLNPIENLRTTSVYVHWIYLIHEFHNLSWITEINELFHDILIYWDAPVYILYIFFFFEKNYVKMSVSKRINQAFGELLLFISHSLYCITLCIAPQ